MKFNNRWDEDQRWEIYRCNLQFPDGSNEEEMIEKYKIRYYNQFIEKYEPKFQPRERLQNNNIPRPQNTQNVQDPPSQLQTFSVVLNLVIMVTSLMGIFLDNQYQQSLTFSIINFLITIIKNYGVTFF